MHTVQLGPIEPFKSGPKTRDFGVLKRGTSPPALPPPPPLMALQLRSRGRTLGNPSLIHFFSTTSSSNPPPSPDSNDPNGQSNSSTSQSSMSSYFSDVKASLRNHQPSSPPEPRISKSPNRQPSLFRPSKLHSLEEIRKNLGEFRHRSAAPPPNETNPTPSSSGLSSSQNFSSQDPYKRYVTGKTEDAVKGGGVDALSSIRESLRQLRPTGDTQNEKKAVDPMSLSALKNTLKLKPTDSSWPTNSSSPSKVFGGTEPLVFGRESREKKDGHSSNAMRTEFMKMYSYGELGEKLRKLRPDAKREGWFSLGELNDRLMKLRDMEEKEAESRVGGFSFMDLRDSLVKLKQSENEKPKVHRYDILGQLGRTPEFMLNPPKEHLVETAKKMKLELAKVRDEFKMSESDCGSARVQVAQLTTKIKHLSSVLHKKDKHSRKGLVAMVQRRKRLLKYLRRVDWDSYCFVLSKLGLRDNPDYKN
ncbi:hypothetical protein FNV43_RR06453 [Rhamnella rubrinervis]|uniref:Small ribosomal subunit protein uS15c n=1 Tax=Rhamnella rubrinervis TaxID=2594499 RepID=A0A8K0HEM2_9ROSA|nr:hypothetical protein FNV43_RR06453 [Rhamnella rubrinervis]